MKFPLTLGVSARHVHLCEADLLKLFGEKAELHIKKTIAQPGQYAAEEQITLTTEKGSMKLRVIGPLRKDTQIEMSMTDARTVGLKPPVRISGDIENSPGARLVGPAGEVELEKGIIIAARHIHLCAETAEKYGLREGDTVDIRTEGERALTFREVPVRSGKAHADEYHIDTDEGNACGLDTGAVVEVIIKK